MNEILVITILILVASNLLNMYHIGNLKRKMVELEEDNANAELASITNGFKKGTIINLKKGNPPANE